MIETCDSISKLRLLNVLRILFSDDDCLSFLITTGLLIKKKIENCCNRPTLDIIISLVINTAANNLILQLQSLYHDQIRDQDITKLHSE